MPLTSRQALEKLESCFAAIAALDTDRLVAHYTDDYLLERPYVTPGEPLVAHGRDEARGFLAAILAEQRMLITIDRSFWIEDEQLMIAEYSSTGEFLDSAEPYQNSYVGFWYFEGELVRRLREYYNPQAPRASAI